MKYTAIAGDFAPAAGQPGSTAVSATDPAITRWAESVVSYQPGADLDLQWQNPSEALGPAGTDAFAVLSLGRGGSVTLEWSEPIVSRPGPDFAVFENGFSDIFLELAHVEVSSDGVNFLRFPSISHTSATANRMDPTKVFQLAGKYRINFGTPFDLQSLAGHPQLDVEAVRFIRLVDVVGDGSDLDSLGNPIYDPHPTFGSAGFDLDAVAILDLPPLSLIDVRETAGQFEVKWSVEPGSTYELQSNPGLDSDGWSALEQFTASNRQWSYNTPSEGSQRYLRLRQLP